MRLSSYPYVVVRIACSKFPRQGAYKLARLADRYGAETEMVRLLQQLAGDCKLSVCRRPGIDVCGAFFPDINPQLPPGASASGRPKLRAVK